MDINEKIDVSKMIPRDERPIEVMSLEQAHSNMWEWDIPQSVIDEEMEKYGFIYKCIADCGSSIGVANTFDYSLFGGRNIVEMIMTMKPFGHLKQEVITIMYPEIGLSPEWQSAFVWACTKHPDWKHVKELRIITRCPFFISDCKSQFCRIISKEAVSPSAGAEAYEYHIPEGRKDFERLNYNRVDWGLGKPDEKAYAVYLNGAKDPRIVHYITEDSNYVYWLDIKNDYTEIKQYRTPHLDFWFKLNALWIHDIPTEEMKQLTDLKGWDALLKKYAQ